MLDTSSTINRRAHSHANVIPKASIIATKILCPVIRFRPLFPPTLPTHLSFPPASSSHPRTQRTCISTSPPAAPHLRPRRTPDTPPGTPRALPQALPSHTPRPSPATPPGTSRALPGHSPRFSPRLSPPSPKSHVIPPRPRSLTARKLRNINDPISKPETSSGELRATLLRVVAVVTRDPVTAHVGPMTCWALAPAREPDEMCVGGSAQVHVEG